MIKLSFTNMDHLLAVKKVLQPIAEKNKRKEQSSGVYEEVAQLATFGNDRPEKSASKGKLSHEVLENILDLREFDIQYYMRVAIDCDLRVGLWYSVKPIQGNILIQNRPDKITRADPVVLAFDIETTKLPLKFPDSAFDSIMMISYMVDGQGFLITNRDIVSDDIADFEYTPKPEFEGPFIIFNEENEVSFIFLFIKFDKI